MIDFQLTESDQKILDAVRAEALICRKYARYYDENEHEFPPEELEEAKDSANVYAMLGSRDELDTSLGQLVDGAVDRQWRLEDDRVGALQVGLCDLEVGAPGP